MSSEKNNLQPATIFGIFVQFVLGTIPAIILVIALWSGTTNSGIKNLEIFASMGFITFCGIFSAIWGNKFRDKILDLMSYINLG